MMETLKQLKEKSKTASRAREIISAKLKTMEYLKNGIPRDKEVELHKKLDSTIHKYLGKREDEK